MPTNTTPIPGNDGRSESALAPRIGEAQFLRGLQSPLTLLSKEQRTDLNQRVSNAAQAACSKLNNSQILPALDLIKDAYMNISNMGSPLLERSAGKRLIQATNLAIERARKVMSASELEKNEKLLEQLEKSSRNVV